MEWPLIGSYFYPSDVDKKILCVKCNDSYINMPPCVEATMEQGIVPPHSNALYLGM